MKNGGITQSGFQTSDNYLATDNRLASISGGSTRTFTHDAAGNVTYDNRSGTGYGYTYNAANRMESFSINGVVQAEYKYNYLGQQAIRTLTQTGQVINSIYGPDGNRIAEFDFDPVANTSTLIREYVWFEGKPIAVVEGGVVYYVRSDHIGKPVFATDATGTKVWEATYLPFGGVHTSSGANINLRFPGQWFQSESGLHQNWMRDYDPTTGRYIQADPLGLVDGASVYGYARQNPGRYIDQRGEQTSKGSSAVSAASSGTTSSCGNPCLAARERVRNAKDQHRKIFGKASCRIGDPKYVLLTKWYRWREECAARRERDRICPALPPQLPAKPNAKGEWLANSQACRNATSCAIILGYSIVTKPKEP